MKIAPCHIRKCVPADWSLLETIFSEQERITMPEGYFDEFKETIRNPDHLYLVAEIESKVVGGGGLTILEKGIAAHLHFGLVERSRQRQGIGTAILLARLSLLEPADEGCWIGLQATEWTAPFFQRIGFGFHPPDVDHRGVVFHSGYLRLSSPQVEAIKQIVSRAGVTIEAGTEV